jgi:hypothetical protein
MASRVGLRLLLICSVYLIGAVLVEAQEKPPVHITDRDTWREEGGFARTGDSAVGGYRAGVVRQNTELIKTFNKACPSVAVTADRQNAEYIVIWDHTDWRDTSWTGKQNQFAVYKPSGDLVGSGAAARMPNAAKGICSIIQNDKAPPTHRAPAKH